jgi:hypothetical protein
MLLSEYDSPQILGRQAVPQLAIQAEYEFYSSSPLPPDRSEHS